MNRYTPQQLLQMYTPQQLLQMYGQQQLLQMYTPQQLLQMYGQPQLIQMYTPQQIQQMFGQPQQQNTFGQPQQQNTFGQPQQNTFGRAQQNTFGQPQQQTNIGSRYDRPVDTCNTGYVQTTQQPEVIINEPVEPDYKPLPGNEYEPLLIDGLKMEKEIIGGYFKYILNGEPTMNINIEKLKVLPGNENIVISNDDIKKIPIINAGTKHLKRIAIEDGDESTALNTLNAVEHIVTKNVDPLYFMSLVNDSKNLNDMANKLRLSLNNPNIDPTDKDYFENINSFLTDKINSIFINKLGSKTTIDSFVEDINELYAYISNSLDSETSNRYNNELTKLVRLLKIDTVESKDIVDKDTESGEKTNIAYIMELLAVIYTRNNVVDKTLLNMDNDKVYSIKPTNHPILFKLLGTAYKETVMKNGCTGIIATNKHSGLVESTPNGYFTIRKH